MNLRRRWGVGLVLAAALVGWLLGRLTPRDDTPAGAGPRTVEAATPVPPSVLPAPPVLAALFEDAGRATDRARAPRKTTEAAVLAPAVPAPTASPDAGVEEENEADASVARAPEPRDAGAPERCTLEGTALLLRNGKPVPSAEAALVVYISGVRQVVPHQTVTVLQENKQFVPQLLVLHAGDSLRFENRDYVDHSVFSNSGANTFDLPRSSRGVTGTRTFTRPGALRLQCDIHGTMRADVLVLENSFHARVDGAGAFRIEGLERRRYTLVAWEPNGGVSRRDVDPCGPPVALSVVENPPPDLRHRTGEPYVREYEAP